MNRFLAICSLSCVMATPAVAVLIDDAASYIHERCLEPLTSVKAVTALREGFGGHGDLDIAGKRFPQKFGDMMPFHVLTEVIPGDPTKGYILSLFISRSK
jgi:hypothetical protein